MAKKQRRPPARNGGGAGKKAKVGGREALEQEARATFFGGEEDEEISSSDSEAEGERDRGGDGGEEETVEQARMRYAQKYLEEARADERAAKKKQGYRYDEKRDVLDEDDDDDDDDDDDGRRRRRRRLEGGAADGRYAATAGSDGLVHVWDARSARLAHSLRGHKGRVTCLAFRDDAHARLGGGDDDGLGGGDASSQLFSGGDDGSVKHWGAKAGAYVETLFGHEAPVAALDCAYEEKPLSGGRDRTARCWKIRDESHLVYRSPTAGGLGSSVDACRVLDRDRFLTGGDDGALSLWSARRKKPVVSVKRAHGAGAAAQALGAAAAAASRARAPLAPERRGAAPRRRRRLGLLRRRRAPLDRRRQGRRSRSSSPSALPQLGFVNGLAAPRDAAFLAAAVAKEPRLGRWEKVAKAKNRVVLYPLLNSGSAL
ncbi:snoRNA binding protein [Aureococcus anophagefferens]|nr:snoRNA binding protein [Aureococcus anophagefferens]